jgi:co-chaperonin GroES (HSP10)
MKKKLRLLGDNILIRLDPESEKTSSGIIFRPNEAMETILRTGEIIGTGPGKWAKNKDIDLDTRVPMVVEVGEGVIINRFIASNTKTAENLHQFILDEDEALIKASDILLLYDRKTPIKLG